MDVEQPFNRLSPAQAERLALLIEECAEVQQAATKILRHGYDSFHPETLLDNRKALMQECGDLQAAITLMISESDFSAADMTAAMESKIERVINYLHHQPYAKARHERSDRCPHGVHGTDCFTCNLEIAHDGN